MPVYEYFCPRCKVKFELLRPLSRAAEKALCKVCNTESERALSVFACVSKNSAGESTPVGGAPSCGGCTSTGCATCRPS